MIPIISLFDTFCGLLSAFLFFHIWRGYKNQQKIALKYFAMFYLYFVLFFVMASVPGLVSSDGYVIALTANIGYFLLFIAVAYLLNVTLLMYKQYWWQPWAFGSVIFIGAVLFICNLFVLRPAVEIFSPPFVYYLVQEYSILRILEGAAPLLIATITAVMFAREGRRLSRQLQEGKPSALTASISESEQSSNLAHRSYTIAVGLTVLVLAGVGNYIVFAFIPNGLTFFYSGILASSALLIIAYGVEV
jgi:hypothetical protein